MALRAPHRGFTLLEMMVAVGASGVVLAMVVGAALAQQRAFFGSERVRAAQASARAAQLFLEEKVRLAGFGMDAALAFDFEFYTPETDPWFPCPAEADGCRRDAVDNNDELVFYQRNPSYWVPNDLTGRPVGRAWLVRSVDAGAVTIDANAGDVFPAGQILAAVCPGGRYYAYMTVSETTPSNAASGLPSAGTQQIPLLPANPKNPFRRQDLASGPAADPPAYFDQTGKLLEAPTASACFSSGQARLFQIDRYRFHVRPVAVGGGGGKTKYDPYLMLDMGIDANGDGVIDAADEMVIAEGVEMLQVAYVLANSGQPTPAVGSSPGIPIAFTPGLPGSTGVGDEITIVPLPPPLPLSFPYAPRMASADNPYAAWSWYSYSLTPPLPANHPRMTDAQANIRAVQIAMVVRSAEPDPQAPPSIVLDGTFHLLNLNAVPAWIRDSATPSLAADGYQRIRVETAVLAPNMTTRGMMFF